jgi:hypothetical protein
VRTTLGSYRLAFLTSGSVCLVAALLALAIGRRGASTPEVSSEVPPGATAA